jgi:hypothetical protein
VAESGMTAPAKNRSAGRTECRSTSDRLPRAWRRSAPEAYRLLVARGGGCKDHSTIASRSSLLERPAQPLGAPAAQASPFGPWRKRFYRRRSGRRAVLKQTATFRRNRENIGLWHSSNELA